MKNVYLFYMILALCSACAKPNSKIKNPIISEFNKWEIIENAVKEKWSFNKIKSFIGMPKEIIRFKGSSNDSYLYSDANTGFQSWSFNFDSSDIIESFSYFPTSTGQPMFMNDLRQRWSKLKCLEKFEPSTISHVIKKDKYLSCNNDKLKAYYNKYEEVESISVKK